MTPMDIIIFLGVVTIAWIISSFYPRYKFEPTKEFDSPKDQDYYSIGASLNNYAEDEVQQTSLMQTETVNIEVEYDTKDIKSVSWDGKTRVVLNIEYP